MRFAGYNTQNASSSTRGASGKTGFLVTDCDFIDVPVTVFSIRLVTSQRRDQPLILIPSKKIYILRRK